MDKRLEAAVTRGSGIETKAGFIVTASGLVAGSSALTATPAPISHWSIIPIAFALLGVSASVWALWTRKLSVPNARSIVDGHVDKPITSEQLEDILLEIRTREVQEREKHNSLRAKIVTFGFVLLAAAIAALLMFVITIRQFEPPGDPHGPQTSAPATTREQ